MSSVNNNSIPINLHQTSPTSNQIHNIPQTTIFPKCLKTIGTAYSGVATSREKAKLKDSNEWKNFSGAVQNVGRSLFICGKGLTLTTGLCFAGLAYTTAQLAPATGLAVGIGISVAVHCPPLMIATAPLFYLAFTLAGGLTANLLGSMGAGLVNLSTGVDIHEKGSGFLTPEQLVDKCAKGGVLSNLKHLKKLGNLNTSNPVNAPVTSSPSQVSASPISSGTSTQAPSTQLASAPLTSSSTETLARPLASPAPSITQTNTPPTPFLDSKQQVQEQTNLFLDFHNIVIDGLSIGETRPVIFEGQTLNLECREDLGVKTYTYSTPTGKRVFLMNDFTASKYYNGPKTQDFITRLNLFVDTAIEKLPQSAPQLRRIQETCAKAIYDRSEISSLDHLISPDFDAKYEQAVNLLAFAFSEVEHMLRSHGITEPLVHLEKIHIEERGRPTIINAFKLNDQTLLSIQKPILEKTTPSSIRTKEGLCNAVLTCSGYLNEKGKVVITFESCRHSSTPPIAIKDPIQRQQIAALNVKQEIEQMVKVKVDPAAISSEASPIEMDWNLMMLLTAKKGDFVRNRSGFIMGAWKGEGESLMLMETLQSINLYANRPIPITVDGREHWVKLNISCMNMGCNPAATVRIADAKIQQGLNAEGFVLFEKQTDAYLLKRIQEKGLDPSSLIEYQALKQNIKATQTYLDRKQIVDQELATLRSELGIHLSENVPSKNRIANLNKQILRLENSVRELAIEASLANYASYLNDGDLLKALRNNIIGEIESSSLNNEEKKNLRLVLQNQALFAESMIEAHNKNPKTVMNSQSIYLQTLSLMNTWSSFFCKSGEDRTGNVDILVAARDIHYNIHGNDPESAESKEDMEREILPILFQTSAALDNTEQNSDARGLQISDTVNHVQLKDRINAGKQISLLAKGIPKRAKKLK